VLRDNNKRFFLEEMLKNNRLIMCCSRKSIIFALKDLQISHISLHPHYIGLAKARQRNFTKNLLDQLKQVIDYVMEYKIRDIVKISSTKQMKNFE
jgi:hypothetical protein